MNSAGLRNWRGEITPPKADPPEGQQLLTMTDKDDSQSYDDQHDLLAQEPTTNELSSVPFNEPCAELIRVVRKDEFGRDVIEEIRSKKESKKEHKRKHKRKKHHENMEKRSQSQSPRGALAGTLPPPDPYRPQLDEDRGKRLRRTHRISRSRSRSKRNRSRHHSRSRSWDNKSIRLGSRRRHVRRSSSRTRSRSRGRKYSRSPSLRSGRKRSSVSVERRWTHSAFDTRSPSPPRQVNPLYRPEPEAWASRAGGVYLPRK